MDKFPRKGERENASNKDHAFRPGIAPTAHRFTQEELQMEFNYLQAERITKKLLERGLITGEEFDLIMA